MFLASEDTISLAHTHSPVERYEKLKDYESDHIHIKKKKNRTQAEGKGIDMNLAAHFLLSTPFLWNLSRFL